METVQTELVPSSSPKSELLVAVEQSGLELETGQKLIASFQPLFDQAESWRQKVAVLCPEGVEPKPEDAPIARASRIALKKIRVEVGHKRKALKEDVLRRGRAIDGVAAVVDFLIEPLEAKLEEVEKYAERKEQQRKDALKVQRTELLTPFGVDTAVYLLGEMSDDSFSTLLAATKGAHEAKIEAARKAEADRIEAENKRVAEEARILAENERLKKEAAEREETARLEREKAEAARVAAEQAAQAEKQRIEAEAAEERRKSAEAAKIAAEQAAKEKAEIEAKAKAEREAIEAKSKAEAEAAEAKLAAERAESAARELKVRQEQQALADKAAAEAKAAREAQQQAEEALKIQREVEAARLAKIEADKKAAAAAPDADKIRALGAQVSALIVPAMDTPDGQAAATRITAQIDKFAKWLDAEAAKLSPAATTLF